LRSRKYREDKPFAVMCRDLEEVGEHCKVDEEEKKLLLSMERPIVILKRKNLIFEDFISNFFLNVVIF